MWKFKDFSVTQIFREINLWDSGSAKCAIFTHLEALNLDFYGFFHFSKAEMNQMNQIHSPQNGKNGSFCTSGVLKTDFT